MAGALAHRRIQHLVVIVVFLVVNNFVDQAQELLITTITTLEIDVSFKCWFTKIIHLLVLLVGILDDESATAWCCWP